MTCPLACAPDCRGETEYYAPDPAGACFACQIWAREIFDAATEPLDEARRRALEETRAYLVAHPFHGPVRESGG